MKLTDVWSSGIKTVEGIFKLVLEAPNRSRTPPFGARLDRTTLQGMESPPATVLDWQETREGVDGATIVIIAILLVEPKLARSTVDPVNVDAVEKLKVVLLAPLAIVADAGTTTPALVDVRVIVVGAPGPDRLIAQLPPAPETTLVGLQTNDKRLGAVSKVIVVVRVVGPSEALIRADPTEVTPPAVAVKEAEVEAAGTLTEAGTVRVGLFEVKTTVVPPTGATFVNVTVQEVLPLDARLAAVH